MRMEIKLQQIYMKNKIINIFGEDIYRVKGYIYEIYCKKEKGKLTYISEKQYRSATKNDVRVWAYNNTTKKELIKKLRK